ncbi:eight transmembrane protein EpsH [gamma proteobacterium NOR5-3]|nr:eight transmembrane protein EpsH [gamma proteobacterium NOR5-3]
MLQTLRDDWAKVPALTPLLVILLAVPAVFYATTASMAAIWVNNETFTHGFLILPITLWLIWEQRERIASTPLNRDMRALIALVPTLLLWTLATLIDVAVVQQLAMVALVPLTVWLLLGLPLALALLFPLLYLFFAVPLGQSLIPPMMEFTADFTVYMVQFSGVPIFRDGLSFQLPSGNWSVVEECSGVRYLIASAALGTIYAYITYASLKKRAAFIAASLIVPIIANGFRAYGIVMIGHLSGMQYAVGADHLLYGWVFFGLVIFVLFWVGGFWADSTDPAAKSVEQNGNHGSQEDNDRGISSITTFSAVVLGSLLVLNLGVQTLAGQHPDLPGSANLALPASAGDWILDSEQSLSTWTPLFQNPDLQATGTYRRGSQAVSLHIGYFHSQRQGAEAVSSVNQLTDPYGGDWKLIASRVAKGSSSAVNEAELALGGQKLIVWQAYLVADRLIANAYLAKLYEAIALLQGRREGAYLTLSTPSDASPSELRQRLDSAWQALTPSVMAGVNAVPKQSAQ